MPKSALLTNAPAPPQKLLDQQKYYFITRDAVAPETLHFYHTRQGQHQTSSQQGPRWLQVAPRALTVEQAGTANAETADRNILIMRTFGCGGVIDADLSRETSIAALSAVTI